MSKDEAINIKDEILKKEGSIHICNAITIDGVVLIKDIYWISLISTWQKGARND